jgi:hypothetical protein
MESVTAHNSEKRGPYPLVHTKWHQERQIPDAYSEQFSASMQLIAYCIQHTFKRSRKLAGVLPVSGCIVGQLLQRFFSERLTIEGPFIVLSFTQCVGIGLQFALQVKWFLADVQKFYCIPAAATLASRSVASRCNSGRSLPLRKLHVTEIIHFK